MGLPSLQKCVATIRIPVTTVISYVVPLVLSFPPYIKLSNHTPKYLYEVTTSSSKPSEVVITPEKRGILTKPHYLCFGGVQNKVKGRELVGH